MNQQDIRLAAAKETALELIRLKAMCQAFRVPFNERAQIVLEIAFVMLQGEVNRLENE